MNSAIDKITSMPVRFFAQSLTLSIAFIFCMSHLVLAAEDDEVEQAKPAPLEKAEQVQEEVETPKTSDDQPNEEVKQENELNNQKAGTAGDKPPGDAPQVVVKSVLSKKLDSRLQIGTSVGWASVRTNSGPWTVAAGSAVYGAWRRSKDTSGKLYITARYAPYAGSFAFENTYYDGTIHGFLVGASWLTPANIGGANLKAGVELGYLMLYASPQDGTVADSKAKAGTVAAGIASELYWTILEKMHLGPFVNFYMGGATIAHLGAAASFVF